MKTAETRPTYRDIFPFIIDFWKKARTSLRLLTTIVALLVFWGIFASLSPYFLTWSNFLNILLQASNLTTIAVGMTLVLISKQIDLSVGSVEALAGSVIAVLMVVVGLPIVPAILLGLLIGVFAGWLNGILHVVFGIPTFISTLGMLGIARGLALILTAGRSIYGLPEGFKVIGQGHVGEIPVPVIIAAAWVALGYFLLNHTVYGKHIYAIGGDERSAAYAGVQVARTKIITMMFCALSAAIAGLIITSRLNSGQGTIGELDLLDGIAAVVIGGTALSGGVGSMGGTVMGVLTIGSIRNGLNMLGVSAFWQQVAIGIIIIGAVILDHLQRRYEEK
jgi:ribose transport system permease protein